MKLRPTLLAGLGLTLASIPAMAAAPEAVAGWNVDKTRSQLGFEGSVQGEAFTGQFKDWSADIQFDPDNLAASKASVTVEMGSAETGDPSRDSSLPENDWFATAMFPQATFVTNAIRSTGEGAYVADGTLTIRGISKPASLPFTLAITDGTARMNGSLTLKRTDFEVGKGAWASPSSVAYEVKVNVRVVADKVG